MRLELDDVNRRAYASSGAVRQYGRAVGWLDPGEQFAVERALRNLGSGPILDIGVGGGRTTPLLRSLSESYTGIDYTPDLVAVARRRFPECDFRVMDARRLEFADESFRLVFFSYNGIDSVDEAGREQVLREARRVLEPGGMLVFSSLNRDGSAFGETPWVPERHWKGVSGLLRRGRRTAFGLWRVRYHRALIRDHGDRALGPLAIHDFAVVAMFVSPFAQVNQLQAVGFAVDAVLDDATGGEVDVTRQTRAPWLYYVARKPVSVTEEVAIKPPARLQEEAAD